MKNNLYDRPFVSEALNKQEKIIRFTHEYTIVEHLPCIPDDKPKFVAR